MSTTLVEPKCFFNINEFCYCSKYCHSFIEVTVIDEFKHSILMKFMQSLEISVRSSKYEKDFFSKCDQIHRNLRIWLHLLKKSLMQNFIFCTVKKCIQVEVAQSCIQSCLQTKKTKTVKK